MAQEKMLQVQMLGSFTLALGEQTIREEDSRSKKMWLLLAYLIYCRNRHIPQEELLRLLWEDDCDSVNPYGALKTTLHRLRAQLDRLEPQDELILRKDSTYAWNPDFPMELDIDRFDRFCREAQAAGNDSVKLDLCLQALELYRGDFLPRLSMESWVIPISAYFHNRFLETVRTALPLLEENERFEEALRICSKALSMEPYSEDLYCHLMKNYMATGQNEAAIAAFENLSQLLLENFSVVPSDEVRAIYRSALRRDESRTVPIDSICDQLREENPSPGALFCEYDAFRVIYHTMARSVARTGEPVHIALMTVKGQSGKVLSKRSRDLAMNNLKNQILASIRRGDVAARCSNTQFIIMLPRANYENSCMVCDRIIRSFFRQHPHSPADISYSVQALEPNEGPERE